MRPKRPAEECGDRTKLGINILILIGGSVVEWGSAGQSQQALSLGRYAHEVSAAIKSNALLMRDGAPDTIRTCGLRLRRATLYPAELRVPACLRSAYAETSWL